MLASGGHFYLAAIWEPAMAEWPLSYRIVTVTANAEVSDYQTRHGAIIRPGQVMDWLDLTQPEAELLATPPAGTFVIEELVPGQRQSSLAL